MAIEPLAFLLGDPRSGQVCHALLIAAQGKKALPLKHSRPVLNVLGHVDHHRAGAAAPGDFKRGSNRGFQFLGVLNQKHMFGTGAHDVEHRGFLKGIRADRGARDLPANQHHGNGIRHAVPDRRYRIGRTGT